MKQTCLTRNKEDAAALLGQAEMIMSALRNAPEAEIDAVFGNAPGVTLKSFDGETVQLDMGSATGLDVLTSPTQIEIHAGNAASFTIELTPDRTRSINELVATALHAKPGHSPDSGPAHGKKDISR